MALFGQRRYPTRIFSPENVRVPALVGAAQQEHGRDAGRRTRLRDWQRQALEFYDLLGECWYPAQFYARMLSRVRLYPAIRMPDGEVEEVEDTGAQEILARVQDPGGGQSQWMGSYGRLQFLIGDGYLTVTEAEGQERWEYLSPAEIIPTGEGTFQRVTETGEREELEEAPEGAEEISDGQVRVWRLWRKHPIQSSLPDAPTHAVLPLFEYLMLLQKAARAQALSRIVGSGLLVIADEITLPGLDSEGDDADENDDPFVKRLTQHVIKPISDPGSASAVAPMVARVSIGDRRVDDLIKLIQLHDPTQQGDWHERIDRTIKRIAIGLDMPPEILLGMADTNHWSGWVISDSVWSGHGEPVAIGLCEDLTAAYYRPACIEAGVDNAEKLIVWYDEAAVVTHPDRGADADKVWDRGNLSPKAHRTAHNFNEHDSPNEAEHQEWIDVKTRFADRPQDPPEEPVSDTGADVESGPAGNGDGPTVRTENPSPMNDGMELRIMGAADLAFDRCRELAGSRVRQKRMSCEKCFEGTENVPMGSLVAAVGQEVVQAIGITSEDALVSGGANAFRTTVMRWGLPERQARVLGGLIEAYASATLYEDEPGLPAHFADEIREEVV